MSMLPLLHRLRKIGIIARPGAAKMLGRRLAARSVRARAAGAAVLAYHRVIDLDGDPQLLHVTPLHFAEQLGVLRQHYRVVPLDTLVRRLNDGADVAGMVAITFDDGYVDNLRVAKPLLEQHATPATVFIAANYIGAQRGFWWDELEALLLETDSLPQRLRFRVRGRRYEWDLGADCLQGAQQQGAHRGWHVALGSEPTKRHHVYRALHRLLYALPPDERDALLEKLRNWAGRQNVARPDHRVLTKQELRELADSPLIEIGAHTATHPALALLPRQAQDNEIRLGKQHLEEMIGRPTTHFAYPYGSLSSFNESSVAIVKSAGFASACTTFTDAVRQGADPYALPRVLIRDCDGDEFHRVLRGCMNH
jgi:peptidoglycan/xylan/chitin deacetylase (PgdA/CDA1 family)